ncbi:MAG: hypothetical protein B7Z08_06415 [Sphingomonadales bacterium 32-68-7]|nr:MAG: hypothetical protein B7Z33_12265 [Sphingomonadales bacterium 12-68-11]OYX09162.1 MAG: hypothetical protein B7Z08_06415 [Sphingomonadales bacterium 32-68-7]
MRSTIALIALLLNAAPLAAGSEALDVRSAVFIERSDAQGRRIEPADRLLRGDTIVTVLTWHAPDRAGYTIVSAVPPALALESASHDAMEVSTDGGRTWRALADARDLPSGITHLRWQAQAGDGRLSYRARVR